MYWEYINIMEYCRRKAFDVFKTDDNANTFLVIFQNSFMMKLTGSSLLFVGVICEEVYMTLPENVVASDPIGGEYYVGHKLHLDCEFYHQLFGSTMIECQRNGTWSGGDTYCVKSRCYENAHDGGHQSHQVISRPEVFCKKGVFKNFAKFTGKHVCQSLFFNKVF